MKSLALLAICLLFALSGYSQQTAKQGTIASLPNTLVLQLKASNTPMRVDAGSKSFRTFLASIQATSVKPLFKKLSSNGKYGEALSRVLIIQYDSRKPLYQICEEASRLAEVVYAEPYYIYQTTYLPNDPFTGKGIGTGDTLQFHLAGHHVFEAWDIYKGDPAVTVGVVDNGSQFHEDLIGNIKVNSSDPVDGIDNDNDGYVDNNQGWDIGDNDADPFENSHGGMVAGTCCAVPDNSKGVAGVGFNTTFLPVKAAASTIGGEPNTDGQYVTHGYEGTVYAAEHGCKVINLSWAGSNYSRLMEEVINYVVEEKDAVVVAAAGNTGDETILYPASYENVLSVAGCDPYYSVPQDTILDVRWYNSTYNPMVDISAYARFIYTTFLTSDYRYINGTSFSSPIVAGAAALVRGKFPTLTALQVKELLRVTTDAFDSLDLHRPYRGKTGSGKLNVYKALTATSPVSVRLIQASLAPLVAGNELTPGETVSLQGKVTNYLSPTQKLYVRLSTESPHVTITKGIYPAGSMNTLQSFALGFSDLQFTINPSIPANEKVLFKVEFIDSTLHYYDSQYFAYMLNPAFKTHMLNHVTLTMGANGRFGFIENGSLGEGCSFDAEPLLFEGGLLLGYDTVHVSDCVRGNTGNIDRDFYTIAPVRIMRQDSQEEEFVSKYADLSDQIDVTQTSIASAKPVLDHCILIEYRIRNRSGKEISPLQVGLYTDWDIDAVSGNSCDYLTGENLIYATNGSIYAGVALISGHAMQGNCIDNKATTGPLALADGFSEKEKYLSISTTQSISLVKQDVSSTAGVTLPSLASGQSDNIAFCLLAGNSPGELRRIADSARVYYQEWSHPKSRENSDAVKVYPNPFHESLVVESPALANDDCTVTITDLMGQQVYASNVRPSQNSIHLTIGNLQEGIYILQIKTGEKTLRKKLIKSVF